MKVLFDSLKILGHILVYDISNVFSYKANTVDSTIEFLDALTEEGLAPESSYWIKGNELERARYTSDSHLILDCDLKIEDEVIEFAREYAKFHDLGSAAVFKTSNKN